MEHNLISTTTMVQSEALILNPNIKQKSGLNRNLLNHGLAEFNSMIRYKAKEAGIKFFELNTRQLKPTQRCFSCDGITKKLLSERIHNCKVCNLKLDRDKNSALVMLKETLIKTGLGQALCGVEALASSLKQETPSILV